MKLILFKRDVFIGPNTIFDNFTDRVLCEKARKISCTNCVFYWTFCGNYWNRRFSVRSRHGAPKFMKFIE